MRKLIIATAILFGTAMAAQICQAADQVDENGQPSAYGDFPNEFFLRLLSLRMENQDRITRDQDVELQALIEEADAFRQAFSEGPQSIEDFQKFDKGLLIQILHRMDKPLALLEDNLPHLEAELADLCTTYGIPELFEVVKLLGHNRGQLEMRFVPQKN